MVKGWEGMLCVIGASTTCRLPMSCSCVPPGFLYLALLMKGNKIKIGFSNLRYRFEYSILKFAEIRGNVFRKRVLLSVQSSTVFLTAFLNARPNLGDDRIIIRNWWRWRRRLCVSPTKTELNVTKWCVRIRNTGTERWNWTYRDAERTEYYAKYVHIGNANWNHVEDHLTGAGLTPLLPVNDAFVSHALRVSEA